MDPRRHVPRTDVVLADPRLVAARELLGAALVKKAVTRAQDLARSGTISPDNVADAAAASLPATAASLTPVINATGVIVHTNLGRAPLSDAARDAVTAASATSAGPITPDRASSWAAATARLTSAAPSTSRAATSRGSASTALVLGT